jgi:hypothetical protein
VVAGWQADGVYVGAEWWLGDLRLRLGRARDNAVDQLQCELPVARVVAGREIRGLSLDDGRKFYDSGGDLVRSGGRWSRNSPCERGERRAAYLVGQRMDCL